MCLGTLVFVVQAEDEAHLVSWPAVFVPFGPHTYTCDSEQPLEVLGNVHF